MSKLRVKGLILMVAMCTALSAYSAGTSTRLNVVTSIKPLALLTKLALGDAAVVHTLVPNGANPHNYALKVSDRRALAEADLIVWVGPQMERFLHRVVEQLPAEQVVTVEQLPGLVWPAAAHSSHQHHHEHEHSSRDLHLWLNPDNGIRIVEALNNRLGQPVNSDVSALQAMVTKLDSQLNAVKSRKLAVYHNGYGHFISRFSLQQPYIVTETPEQRPGARHLHLLRQQLPDAACLLVEPSNHNSLSRQLSQHAGLNVVSIDPLGAESDSYQALIANVASAFIRCLDQN